MVSVKRISSPHLLLPISIAVSLLALTIILVFRILSIRSVSSDLAGIESNVIYSVISTLQSHSLYPDPGALPFSITQYTPLYYYVCSLTAVIFSVDPVADIHDVYIIGRSWNLLFNFLTVFAVYRISNGLLKLPALFTFFICVGSFIFMFPHDYSARPDSLHDTLAIWSIYHVMVYVNTAGGNKRFANLFGALVLFVLSVFTKQSGIQLIFIYLIYFLFALDWKAFLFTLIVSAALFAGTVSLFISNYPYFLANVIGGISNGIDLPYFVRFILLRKLFIIHIVPFAAATAFITLNRFLIFRGTPMERFLCLAVTGTFVFATVTALKIGSTLQYYMLFSNLSLLLIFYYINKHKQAYQLKGVLNKISTSVYCTLCVMMIAYIAFIYQTTIVHELNGDVKDQEFVANKTAEFIRHDLALKKGEYVFANLTTDAAIRSRCGINNVLAENCVVPHLDILNYSVTPPKIFGYEAFKTYLKTGKIKYVIQSEPLNPFVITSDFPQILEQHFRLVRKINGYTIYQFVTSENNGI